jgi:sodium/proline symporter
MIFALILTPIIVMVATGGMDPTFAAIELKDASSFDMLKGASFVGVISLMAWGLGYFGQPHILARFMAAESVKAIPAARRISMTWMILCLAGAVAVGFFGIAYFSAHPELAGAVKENPERVFIELAKLLFNPWIAGVLLSAILAAVMSTLSCQLLVCSSAITEDFYKGFLRPGAGQGELVWVGRLAVLGVALLAIWLAADPDSRVLGLVSYAWAGFGAAFGPVVVLSLFWKRMTRNGALAGMLVGAATVIGWKQLGTGLYEMVPGVAFAALAIVVVSRFGRPPSPAMAAGIASASPAANRAANSVSASHHSSGHGRPSPPAAGLLCMGNGGSGHWDSGICGYRRQRSRRPLPPRQWPVGPVYGAAAFETRSVPWWIWPWSNCRVGSLR